MNDPIFTKNDRFARTESHTAAFHGFFETRYIASATAADMNRNTNVICMSSCGSENII
jgi:hypothetical protein